MDGAVSDPKTAADFLNIILDSSARLGRMVEDLLELTRVQSNRTRSRFGPVEAAQLVERTLRVLAPVAAQKKIALRFVPPSGAPRILCDADDIVRALVNLVTTPLNTRGPKNRGRSILESRTGPRGFLWPTRGIGIPKTRWAGFLSDFTVWTRRARTRPRGVGLAIVKHVVENHGGTLAWRASWAKAPCSIFLFFRLKTRASLFFTQSFTILSIPLSY